MPKASPARLPGTSQKVHQAGAEDRREDHVATDAGDEPERQHVGGHAGGVQAESGAGGLDSVEHVLEDLEAETDEGAEHEPVQRGGDLPGRQRDQ